MSSFLFNKSWCKKDGKRYISLCVVSFCAEKPSKPADAGCIQLFSIISYDYKLTWECYRSRSQRHSSFLSVVCFLLFGGVWHWFPHGAKLLRGWSGASSTLDACQSRPPIRCPVGIDVMCCWARLQPARTPPWPRWMMGFVGLFSQERGGWEECMMHERNKWHKMNRLFVFSH